MRLAIFLLSLLLYTNADAQRIKVKESVRQDWSGGIAGRKGTHYNFTLEFSGVKDSIIVDTLWIGDEPIALSSKDGGMPQRNCTMTRKGSSVLLKIHAGTSNYEQDMPYPGKEQEIKTKAPKKYDGVALFCYRYGNEKRYYTIPAIITTLPTQNYP